MNLLKNVILTRANRKADKSISITFTTCLEQNSTEFMKIDELLSTNGILYYSQKDSLTQEEIDEISKADIKKEGKSKSQRLRNTLFILHKETQVKESFNEYYANQMENIINHFKNKIPNES